MLGALGNSTLRRAIADSRGRLYRMAMAWCGDEMLADDLAQEALTAAIEHCHKLRDRNRMDAWLFTILHNCWNRHLRRRKLTQEFTDEIPSQAQGPLSDCVCDEIAQQVRRVVASLPPEQREVISLVELEGLSYCEVSQVLNIPIGTVMSRLHRARKALVARFDAAGDSGMSELRRVTSIHRVK